MTLDEAALKGWVGRTETATDAVTPRLIEEFQATFAPHLAPVAAGDAPPGLHWCLSPAIAGQDGLGPDGHPAKGGFLPPVPLPRRMWAGGEVETFGTLRRDDVVTRRSVIEDVSVKSGRSGQLCFVAVRHEYRTGRGLAVRERQDIVYREAASGPAQPTAAPAQPADRHWTVPATPVLLFRYSAMTFNGHRIHYDLPYATREEGYAGLVVHGPVQATLLFNLATVLAGRVPARFAYRGQSPLIAGPDFRVAGRRADGACWTEGADGGIRMTAQAAMA